MRLRKPDFSEWFRKEKWSVLLLVFAAAVFLIAQTMLSGETDSTEKGEEYAEYETGTVTEIISDTTWQDETADNAWRGEQTLVMEVTSGQYKGDSLLVNNYIGPLYGVPLEKGDSASIIINTYSNKEVKATVYEYNRIGPLIGILLVFFAITILVGGKTGLRSFIALTVTVLCLFRLLIPALLKGAPTLPAVFLTCLYIAIVSFTILGGVHRKTVCAMLGTAAGTAIAMIFGMIAQSFARVDGLRIADVEPLLQLRQTGIPVGLKGLLSAGIIIASLGAVMDVAMSISSSLEEVHSANGQLTVRELFRSGMNIGRDMVGTMTNTLILAFIGSSFTLILYLFSLGLPANELFTSAYVSVEAISSIASSIGMILAIPLTALISASLLSGKH